MTSSGKKTIFMEPLIDSDDSDHEFACGKTIEDLKYEIDVARFYRTLLSENLIGHHSAKTSRKSKQSSKAVQTDPDTSGIPPSWLIFGQELVNELHTGLENMINALYHTPNGYCRGDTVKGLDPPDMKFFSYEDGYWQSKLLPQVKIPATLGINRQVNSENFKNELSSLLEKATRLQNIIPYMTEMEQRKDQDLIEKEIKTSVNKNSSSGEDATTDVAMGQSAKGSRSSQVDASSCTDFSEGSETDSATSRSNMRSRANSGKPAGYNVQKQSDHVVSKRNANGYNHEPIQGIFVTKYKLPQQASRCVEISVPKQQVSKKPLQAVDKAERIRTNNNRDGLIIKGGRISRTSTLMSKGTASSANNASRIKDTHSKVENTCNLNWERRNNELNLIKAGKAGCSFNEGKNFIKRNIRASKFPAHRSVATTGKSTQDAPQSSVFSRNCADKQIKN